MLDDLRLISTVAIGFGLGLVFFGGLWWTVQRGLAMPHSAVWFVVSLFLRTGLVLGGLYLVGASDAFRLLFCLGGFVVARLVVVRLTQNLGLSSFSWKEDGGAPHAR